MDNVRHTMTNNGKNGKRPATTAPTTRFKHKNYNVLFEIKKQQLIRTYSIARHWCIYKHAAFLSTVVHHCNTAFS